MTRFTLRLRHALAHPKVAFVRAREGQIRFLEPPWELIEEYLAPGSVILEAGAADGADTARLAALNGGNVKVIALEPVPTAFHRLEETAASLSNVQTMQLALGSGSGEVDMWESVGAGGSDSSSLLDPALHGQFFSGVNFTSRIRVESVTIDDLLTRIGFPRFDFMWLDLQGLELEVLAASPTARNQVKVIYMEVSRHELYAGAPTYRHVFERMRSWGFVAVHDRVGAISGNVLFMRQPL
jgi:FkbM family methyltransferase